MRKQSLQKALLLTGISVIMITGSVSGAKQNKYEINNKRADTTKLSYMTEGTVGSEAKYATTKITARSEGWIKEELYCDVLFVHKNVKTGKYVTIGKWMTETYGKINSPYLTNSNVKSGTQLQTQAQTKKNPYSGATNTGIYGYVKY